jgi:CSLREA domain-containing protein
VTSRRLGLGPVALALACVVAAAFLGQSSKPVPVHADTVQFSDVTVGDFHSCGLTTDHTVECWGDNSYGQLADGGTDPISQPETVPLDGDAIAVSAGANHTCALLVDSTVECWGDNNSGEIGDGTSGNVVSTPTKVPGLSGVTQISSGDEFSCALLNNTQAWCWGNNAYGAMGNGTSGNNWLGPVPVCGSGTGFACSGGNVLVNVQKISAGGVHACALMTIGTVRCWGSNYEGQLGIGSAPADPLNTTPDCDTQVSNTCRSLPVIVSLGDTATDVSAGGAETCALLNGGALQCWGYNAAGQIGNGTTDTYPWSEPSPQDVVGFNLNTDQVSAGDTSCAVVANDGFCWGANEWAQIGDGTTNDANTPQPISGLSGNVAKISSNGIHTCALTIDGNVWCWGRNSYRELGFDTSDTCGADLQHQGQDIACSKAPAQAHFAVNLTGTVYDGYLTDQHENPLSSILVDLIDTGSHVVQKTYTDESGQYQFYDVPAGVYEVLVVLRDKGDVFGVLDTDTTTKYSGIGVDTVVASSGVTAQDVYFSANSPLPITDHTMPVADAANLANIFYRTQQFIDFAKGTLHATVTSSALPGPVNVIGNSAGAAAAGAFYNSSPSPHIQISTANTAYAARATENTNAPENGEWHEFTHHLYAESVSTLNCPGVDHDGWWTNTSTCWEMNEGTAEFMGGAAWQFIEGGADTNYDGFGSLESNGWMAWSFDQASDGTLYQREDLAVAALLWDLWDNNADSKTTTVITRDGFQHVPVTYTDTISLPIASVWGVLDSLDPNDSTVAGLYDKLNAELPASVTAKTIDLDGDGTMDVSHLDELFLMHGFYNRTNDPVGDGSDRGTVYQVGYGIGTTDHAATGGSWPAMPARRQEPQLPGANLLLTANDGGNPATGASATITVQYPETTETMTVPIDPAGTLWHFELPPYNDAAILGESLPPCNPSSDYTVQVTVRASLNANQSPNQYQFDNCQYLHDVANTTNEYAEALNFSFSQASETPTPPASDTATPTETATPTPTAISTSTDTPTASPTETSTPTASPTPTITPSAGHLFVVDSSDDAVDAAPGDGVCATTLGECTLRAAIQEANADPGFDEIDLPPGTYTLALTGINEDNAYTGDLDIRDDVKIVGDGSATTFIDANHIDRVFDVIGSVTVDFSGLTIENGQTTSDGGGIRNVSGTLTVEDSEITNNATTNGEGGGIANANSAHNAGGTVTLTDDSVDHNTAITNTVGFGLGGGVYNGRNLTLTNTLVHDNQATAGAGINSNVRGTSVTLSGSQVYANSVAVIFGQNPLPQSWTGGGITAGGNLTIDDSTIHDNVDAVTYDSTVWGEGGGIIYDPDPTNTFSLTNSTVSNNTAGVSGGGVYLLAAQDSASSPPMTISGSDISGNSAGSGAGIYEMGGGVLQISDSTINGNHAAQDGGGIIDSSYEFGLAGSALQIDGSTIDGNSAGTNGGGIETFGAGTGAAGAPLTMTNSTVSNNTAGEHGGGFHNDSVSTVTGSTFTGNSVAGPGNADPNLEGEGGAIANDYQLTITNSTISGNTAGVDGGGLYNTRLLKLNFSTVANNTADADHDGSGDGGGVYGPGGLIPAAQTQVDSTILSDNHDSGGEAPDCGGTGYLVEATHNLIGSKGNCTTTIGDATGDVSPPSDLQPLADNGGGTLTQALGPLSNALDAGDPDTCPPTDQRGVTRPQGASCDIGAWEGAPPAQPTDTPTDTATPAVTATFTATATETPTETSTSVATATNTPTPTQAPTDTPTSSATPTRTASPIPSATDTPTSTPTATQTAAATDTPTPTPSATSTPPPTETATTRTTDTPAPTSSSTATEAATVTPTATETPTAVDTATNTATATETPTPAITATNTLVPAQTKTPLRTVTAERTKSPSRTATVVGTRTRTPVPTASSTPTPAPREERCADMNRDGQVDFYDLILVSVHTLGRFDTDYDLNDDHRVNVWDVWMVLRDFGRHCHRLAPPPAGPHPW